MRDVLEAQSVSGDGVQVKFSIFDHMERRDEPLHELYESRIQLIELAEALGFHCYHKAEHHHTVLDVASSANVFFAAAAQRTERIRFGSLVYLLPFYHPMRLLEEICLVDQLSRGRLDVGVGKGISPVEHQLWGLDPDDAKLSFEESFALLRRGLCGELELPFEQAPFQQSGPPIWYPGNVQYAGKHRLNTIVGGPTAMLEGAVNAYDAQLSDPEANWNPGVQNPVIGVSRHIYVAETDEAARERVMQAYPKYSDNLLSLWRAYDEYPDPDPSVGGNTETALGAQVLVAGSPESVINHVKAVQQQGINYFVGSFAWGDLDANEAKHSLSLFGKEVMPNFYD